MSLARSQNTKSKCKNLLGIPCSNVLYHMYLLFMYRLPVLKFIIRSNKIVSCYTCRGTYDILVTKDNQTRSVGQYDNRGSFGELALMYNTPRAATIVATSEGSLWGLVSREMVPLAWHSVHSPYFWVSILGMFINTIFYSQLSERHCGRSCTNVFFYFSKMICQ